MFVRKLLIKRPAIERKRTMIRYAIEQEDRQTVRMDEMDTKLFKRKRLERCLGGGKFQFVK